MSKGKSRVGWRTYLRLGNLSFALLLAAIVAVPAFTQDMKGVSSSLATRIAASGRKTVAVIDFTDLQGNVTELGRFLAEELSVDLVADAKAFEVIERTQLRVILQEHKLGTTGLIDPQTARKLGQIAGVETLVTGTITPLGDSVRLSAKVLDTTTARMIGAYTVDIPKTRAIEELLAKAIGNSQPSSGAASGTPGTKKQTVGDLQLELTSCQRRRDKVLCAFRVTNLREDHEYMLLGQTYDTVSRAVDDNGGMFPAEEVQIGGQSGKQVVKTVLPSSVPVACGVTFSGIPAEVSKLSLLEIRFTDDWNNRPGGSKFQVRNVSIQ